MLVWDQHIVYFEDALAKNDRCDWAGALESWDHALAVRDSIWARWNRGQALLSLGRYEEGFRDYAVRFKVFADMLNTCARDARARLPLWCGEDIRGKQLVLLGEQGYGDLIMMARYVPALQAMGIDVVLAVPQPLHRLLSQLAPLGDDGDYCCPFFDLMVNLQQTAATVPGQPYLRADPLLRQDWLRKLPASTAAHVGIAWKAATPNIPRTFQRNVPLEEFLELIDARDAVLVSLQPDDAEEARRLGVVVPYYEDFADVAAVASLMDQVVAIDVAAINVAGAIGHPNCTVLLPHLASWRWLGPHVWYPHVHRAQQTAPGDWASAFAKIRGRP
jgi:hypothetical protein